MEDKDLATIKDYLWRALSGMSCGISYGFGFDPEFAAHKEDVTALNYIAFGIKDRDDAFAKAHRCAIYVHGDYDTYKNHYVVVNFYPEWEQGHGCEVIH